jgi:amino acid transporter
MSEAAATQAVRELRRELSLRDLILFSIAGLIGARWLSSAAHTGPGAVSLWIFAAIFFLIPSAFSMAKLSARWPDEGGLYVWTRECFGPWHGFLCFWLYWLSLAFWFPGALMAVSSMTAYALGPGIAPLADNRWFVLPIALALLWAAIGANLIGLRFGKWVDNLGGAANIVLCVLLASVAALVWFARGPATPIDIAPHWNWERVNFWSQICYALTGLELAPVLGGEIRNPIRNLPLASLSASPVVTLFYVAGTLSLLIVLPADQISPLNGIAQAAASAGSSIGAPWLARVVAALILLGAFGQLSVLGAVAARLPFVVGVDSFLPPAFARVHPRWHTPHIPLLFFGAMCTVVLIVAQAGETARAAYQIVTDLMVIGGFIPFLYIFAAAWKCGARWSAASGLAVSALAIACSVVPTADVRSAFVFEAKLAIVTGMLVLTARWIFVKHQAQRRAG